MILVSVETAGGNVVFGPAEVDAGLKISELKLLVEPGHKMGLLDKATFQLLKDEDSLQDSVLSLPDIVLMKVPHVETPAEAPSAPGPPELQRLRTYELNMKERLLVGDRFGADDEYTIDKELGEGAEGQVFACTHQDGGRFAVKVLRKSVLVKKNDVAGAEVEDTRGYINLRRELECLRSLHHKSIVHLVDMLDTDLHIFLLMDLGQENLGSYAKRVGTLEQPEARHVFLQLLEGLSFMHSQGYMHRDLKPQNFIVYGVEKNQEGWNEISVRIGDFGLSKQVGLGVSPSSASRLSLAGDRPAALLPAVSTPPTPMVRVSSAPTPGEQEVPPPPMLLQKATTGGQPEVSPMLQLTRATTRVGTPIFMAPEVLRHDFTGSYGKQVDYFSLGVCLLVLMTGMPGLEQLESQRKYRRPVDDALDYDLLGCEEFAQLPASAQTLISGLLRVDPARRFMHADCCASAWVRAQHSPSPLEEPLSRKALA